VAAPKALRPPWTLTEAMKAGTTPFTSQDSRALPVV